jgi:hypothetical protein
MDAHLGEQRRSEGDKLYSSFCAWRSPLYYEVINWFHKAQDFVATHRSGWVEDADDGGFYGAGGLRVSL